jgi:ABC-type transporter Mla subunit MlaD
MKIFLSKPERTAGLFIVGTVALVIVFFVGAAVQNKWLTPRVHFHTTVVHGDGLRPGAPILLSGVEVGEIHALKLRSHGAIDVDMVVLKDHAGLIQAGTHVAIRRLLGFGEKRIHLTPPAGNAPVLHPGSTLTAVEQVDIPEALAELDLGTYLSTMNRAMAAMELVLKKFEDGDRLERLVNALDRLGPVVEKVDTLLDEVHEPVVALLRNPALPQTLEAANELLHDPTLHLTLAGMSQLTNDPATRKLVHGAAAVLDPERLNKMLEHVETLTARLDAMTGEKGAVTHILESADKLVAGDRVDRLVSAVERLTDEKKLGRILDNVSVLAEQTAKIGPEIPRLTHELTITLREAVVVLKAVQKTWMLEGKSDDARKEMDKSKDFQDGAPKSPDGTDSGAP